MVNETFHAHALPDDFANRICRLIEARGAVVEALFNPDAPPSLRVSEEANRRAVAVARKVAVHIASKRRPPATVRSREDAPVAG